MNGGSVASACRSTDPTSGAGQIPLLSVRTQTVILSTGTTRVPGSKPVLKSRCRGKHGRSENEMVLVPLPLQHALRGSSRLLRLCRHLAPVEHRSDRAGCNSHRRCRRHSQGGSVAVADLTLLIALVAVYTLPTLAVILIVFVGRKP